MIIARTVNYFCVISFVLGILHFFVQGQELRAELLSAKLPTPNRRPYPSFDGTDRIFLLGGWNFDTNDDQILVFNITSEEIQVVGRLPAVARLGSLQSDSTGNIYYLGGGESRNLAMQYNPSSNFSRIVGNTFPYRMDSSTTLKYNDTHVYILGGEGGLRGIISFDMVRHWLTILPEELPVDLYNVKTSVRVGHRAFVFCDNVNRTAYEFDLESMSLRSVGEAGTIPNFLYLYPTSVTDGRWVYIIGGFTEEVNFPAGGILQFDPITYAATFLPVRNWPVGGGDADGNDSHYNNAPASVFVPGLNRIYFFGGSSYNGTGTRNRDEIFFVDLAPLGEPSTTTPGTPSPDLFSCLNKSDGFYPHPSDCSKYMQCRDEVLVDTLQCPEPLLFHPELGVCTWPEEVECGLTCEGRPDGSYPHPHDCALFILCRAGVPNVFRCNPPYLFDPEVKLCVHPDEVECALT